LDFVQFADGSTFGDPAGAHDALALRDTIMVGLRELLQSYADGGEEGFAAKLKEPSVVSGTAPYKKILTKFSDIGVLAALGETKQIVAIAEHHAAMIAGTATTEKVLPPSP
jgi:hypothetical protein